MASHSRTLARKIPWVEEPHRLQPMGSQRARHDKATATKRIVTTQCHENTVTEVPCTLLNLLLFVRHITDLYSTGHLTRGSLWVEMCKKRIE